jgi:hypothetical protein
MATITADDINNGSSDNCDATLSLSLSKTAFDCCNIGNNTVMLTVTDNNGNEANCTVVVTVEASALDPELIEWGNVSILLSCDIPYTFVPMYNAPNGCPVIITHIESKKCTACNKEGNIFGRDDSDKCDIEYDEFERGNVTIFGGCWR